MGHWFAHTGLGGISGSFPARCPGLSWVAPLGLAGKEGLIMRQTIKYTIPYVILLALMTWGFAFMFPGLVP